MASICTTTSRHSEDNTITDNSSYGVYFGTYNNYATLRDNTITGKAAMASTSILTTSYLQRNTIADNNGEALHPYYGYSYYHLHNNLIGNCGCGLDFYSGTTLPGTTPSPTTAQ